MDIFLANVPDVPAVALSVAAEDREIDRYQQCAETIAGFDAVAFGESDEPRDFGDFVIVDPAAGELLRCKLGTSLFIAVQARVVDGIVPQDGPAKQPAVPLGKVVNVGQLTEAFLEVPHVMIMPRRLGVGSSGL
jgi:hypothetical protein